MLSRFNKVAASSRITASAFLLIGLLIVAPGRALADQPIKKIAFGSCATQQRPCPIWSTIADYQADWLLLLGDNIYADIVEGRLKPATPERIQEAYDELARVPAFLRLRQQTPIFATWDDHDYGNNDAGVEWEHKDAAAKMFHDFFGTPSDSPLRKQRGIYDAKIIGPPGKRVQMIMLDTRYFRSELEKGTEPLPGFRGKPYVATSGENVTMLGDAQWKWLAEQLKQPAELRIIGSSIQVLSDDHPFEKWGNMPDERERLFELIQAQEASGVVIISGDRHLGEISVDNDAVGYPLYDITASGLNQANLGWRMPELNIRRHSSLPYGNHYGSIEIDWDAEDPVVSLQLRHEDGEIAVQSRVPLSKLTAGPAPKPRPAGVVSPLQALAMNEADALTVQFTVVAGRVIGDGERILLNSDSDFRGPKNFTVVVNRSALTGAYENANFESFKGKTIRVTGAISLYNSAKQLQVDDAAKLLLIE